MASIFDLFKKTEKKEASSAGPPEYIVAGLGNPGREYIYTRHNVGFSAIDFICRKHSVECTSSKFKSLVSMISFGDKKVLLMKPQTFMNNSGIALREASAFYKIPPENITVICDDISFEPGKMRIRAKGSDGGHNGLKSITEQLSSDAFPRIKIGVGNKPCAEYDLAKWVLGTIPAEDMKNVVSCLEATDDICEKIIAGKIQTAMGIYNKR